MDRINNIIADIMPKDLVLIDLVQDKSSIRIIVDGAKSVDLDTTAYIAKKIRNSESLNKYLPKDFRLEVSSPGIDSPLTYPFQYKKNIGRQLKIKELSTSNEIKAKLTHVIEDGIVATNNIGKTIKFKFDEIESATIITVF
jgi:ribosome maturation factor RimP